MYPRRPYRTIVIAVLTLFVPIAPAGAQGVMASSPAPQSVPRDIIIGQSCQRRTDNIPGIVKMDACGRIYCGRIDINDITVLNPRFAEDMQCRWTLVEELCKCVPTQ